MKTQFLKLSLAITLLLSISAPSMAQSAIDTPTVKSSQQGSYVSLFDLINEPDSYLNKTINIRGTFERFSTLGLDYKKAYRSSDNYIAFLIRSAESPIPLSEIKLFLKRETAEKLTDLESGDKISIKGTVFSTALGDPWLDAEEVEIIEKVKK